MIPNLLQKIKYATLQRIYAQNADLPQLQRQVENLPAPLNFSAALSRFPAIIAEVKYASPSAGLIRPFENPAGLAQQYVDAGAAAISVITEPNFFLGSLHYLRSIRKQLPHTPLLMKDFIFDESQILQGRLFGADAILLIVACLSSAQLQRLFAFAQSLQLTPLVEVHDRQELATAIAIGATLIGVNNRDLHSFHVDIQASIDLAVDIPSQVKLVSESGLHHGAQLLKLRDAGYSGFLIGSHFMAAPHVGKKLSTLMQEAQHHAPAS